MRFHDELEQGQTPALRIIVAKHNKTVRAILLCQKWKGIRVHWFGGHTIACCGTEACPACHVGKEWVKKYYIAAVSPATGNQAIVMLTPAAADQVFSHRRISTGLLGMEVILARAASRNTAPMTATVVNYHPDTEDFTTVRLERVLLRIFATNAQLKSA